jgi:hypothetical protein
MVKLFLRMEQVVLFLLAVILGLLISRILSYIYDSNPDKIDKLTTPKGYHLHHSMYGITSFVAVPFMFDHHHFATTLFLLGFGLGVILEHTIQCGFVFLTKQVNKERG